MEKVKKAKKVTKKVNSAEFALSLDFDEIQKKIQQFLDDNIIYNTSYLSEITRSINHCVTDAVRAIIIKEIQKYFRDNKDIKVHLHKEIDKLLPGLMKDHLYTPLRKALREALHRSVPD